uniref:Uncharacterized protein n=1 Tax=Brassica campestris TaxID=3711 RepID=A0A3P5ZMQ5_BRACM|nr:unnamed protein product [Brassica rapa]
MMMPLRWLTMMLENLWSKTERKKLFFSQKKKGRMFSRRRETSNISTVEMPM